MRTKTLILLAGAGFVGYKTLIVLKLEHFTISEFRGFHFFLSFDVLFKLDAFRERLNHPVMISPAPGSIVRFDLGKESSHLYGRAIDVMIPDRPGLITPSLENCFNIARSVGFNEIGVYPFWKPYKGLHLGLKAPFSQVFTWSDVSQVRGEHNYAALTQGFYYG